MKRKMNILMNGNKKSKKEKNKNENEIIEKDKEDKKEE